MTANIKIVSSGAIGRCPKTSLLPAHYRDDGTCRCDDREAALAELDEARAAALVAEDRVREARRRVEIS